MRLTVLFIVVIISFSKSFSIEWEYTNGPGGCKLIDISTIPTEKYALGLTEDGEIVFADDINMGWNKVVTPVTTYEIIQVGLINRNKWLIFDYYNGYFTNDNGESFSFLGELNYSCIEFVSDGQNCFIISSGKIQYSIDGGESWQCTDPENAYTNYGIVSSPCIANDKLYFFSGSLLSKKIICFDPATEENSSIDLPEYFSPSSTLFYHKKSNKFYLFLNKCWESNDYGQNWIDISDQFDSEFHPKIIDNEGNFYDLGLSRILTKDGEFIENDTYMNTHKAFIVNNNQVIVGSFFKGEIIFYLWKPDERRAVPMFEGAPSSVVYSLVNVGEDGIAGISNFSGLNVYSTTNNRWSGKYNHSYKPLENIYAKGDTIWIDNPCSYSPDRGNSWSRVGYGEYTGLSVYYSDGVVYLGTLNGIYMSDNMGNNWYESDVVPKHQIVDIFGMRDGSVIAGSNYDGLYRTSDKGLTWSQVANGAAGTLWSYAHNYNTGETLFGTAAGILSTTDNGISWNKAEWDATGRVARGLVIAPNGDVYIAAHPDKIFRKDASTEELTDITGDLSGRTFYSMVLGADSRLYISTDKGVWRSKADILSVDSKEISNCCLVYPNPSAGQLLVSLQYKGSARNNFPADIYDNMGNKILSNMILTNGDNQIDITGLNNGIYFLNIEADNKILRKSFVISR